jgi:hypothetical protein
MPPLTTLLKALLARTEGGMLSAVEKKLAGKALKDELRVYNVGRAKEFKLPKDVEIVTSDMRSKELGRQFGPPNGGMGGKDTWSSWINDDTGVPVAYKPSGRALAADRIPYERTVPTADDLLKMKLFKQKYYESP